MRQTIRCPTNRTSCTLLILQWQIPCMHLAFQIIQTYVTILLLLILDFQSTATAQGIMKTFIAEFALICCSQLKLCQSKVFNIKYDEFPSALILQNHPAQGDSCQVEHKSTGLGSASQIIVQHPTNAGNCNSIHIILYIASHKYIKLKLLPFLLFPLFKDCCWMFFLDNLFPPSFCFQSVFGQYIPIHLKAKITFIFKTFSLMTITSLFSALNLLQCLESCTGTSVSLLQLAGWCTLALC